MKRLALLAALLLPLSMAFAQQNVGFKTDKVEPLVINPDNSVTFYVEAPKAKSVSVKGDWEASEGNGQMTKGKNGTWSYTTPPTAIRNVHLSFKYRWYLQHRPKQPILLP